MLQRKHLIVPVSYFVCRTSADRRFSRVALTGVLAFSLLLGSAPCNAQPSARQVLVLQSFDRGNMILDQFTTDFRVELDQQVGHPVNSLQVVVGPTGFVA